MVNSQTSSFYTDTSPMAGVSGLQYLSMQSDSASGNPSASWFYNLENQAASQQPTVLSATSAQTSNTSSTQSSWLNWVVAAGVVSLIGVFVYLKYFKGE